MNFLHVSEKRITGKKKLKICESWQKTDLDRGYDKVKSSSQNEWFFIFENVQERLNPFKRQNDF